MKSHASEFYVTVSSEASVKLPSLSTGFLTANFLSKYECYLADSGLVEICWPMINVQKHFV